MNSEKALREALEKARDVLANYADPGSYADNNGEPYKEDDEIHPGALARETLPIIDSALAKPSPAPVEREGAVGIPTNGCIANPIDLDTPEVAAVARAMFLAEHPNAEWSAGRARAIWFTRAAAACDALAALAPEPVRWMEIESAPKDGEIFLAAHADYEDGNMQVVYFDESTGPGIRASDGHVYEGKEWCWHVVDGNHSHRDAFTHWMPLPAAPLSAREGE